MSQSTMPAYITSLMRHFEDLRDGTHGGSASREDKEAHFEKAVQLLAPIARQVLNEMNMNLLRDTGQLTESGLRRTPDGGLSASCALSWCASRPRRRAAACAWSIRWRSTLARRGSCAATGWTSSAAPSRRFTAIGAAAYAVSCAGDST